MKLDFEQYLKVSEFLNNKNSEDFKNYKKEFYKKNSEYNSKDELKYLLEYYDRESINKDESQNILQIMIILKRILIGFAFSLGLILTVLYYDNDKKVDIGLYSITSVIFPLLYFLYLAYIHFSYKFPKKNEPSILNLFLKNKFENFKDELSHVLKTYSTMLWIKSVIYYSIGALITTMLVFKLAGVTFYSGTAYGANDYEKSNQQIEKIISLDKNLTNNKISNNSPKKDESSAYWSRVITAVLIIMIILKIVLYFLARRNNIKTIKQALVNQGEDFFNILKTNADIGLSVDDNEDILLTNQAQNKLNIEEKRSLKKYYILYYEINPEDQSKIQYNISNEENLKNKEFSSYSYCLLKKVKDDINTLKELSNLVIIYTSPETIPDETFKENIIEILTKTQTNDIWIIPLKDEFGKLQLLRKNDKDYNKWDDMIKNINNNHIRIHFDI